jgi:hypothetical protein
MLIFVKLRYYSYYLIFTLQLKSFMYRYVCIGTILYIYYLWYYTILYTYIYIQMQGQEQGTASQFWPYLFLRASICILRLPGFQACSCSFLPHHFWGGCYYSKATVLLFPFSILIRSDSVVAPFSAVVSHHVISHHYHH